MQSPHPQESSRIAGCPRCENYPLEDLGAELVCHTCLCRYQVVNDVPILVPGVTQSRRFAPSDEFVRRIAAIYDLPSTVRPLIRDVFSLDWIIPNVALNTESTQFLHRIRSGGGDLPPLDRQAEEIRPLKGTVSTNGVARDPAVPQCCWLLDYIPSAMAAVSRCTWNIRFENRGKTPIASSGAAASHLSYYWQGTRRRRSIHNLLTQLPVDIAPGRQITVPMLVDTPVEPGHYSLTIGLTVKGGEFVELRSVPVDIYLPELISRVDRAAYTILRTAVRMGAPDARILQMLQTKIAASSTETISGRAAGWNHRMLELDYNADHLDAIHLAMNQVRQLGLAAPRILEIGGNASPMIRDFQGELYNIDIDVHGVQMGRLANRQFGGSINFFVGDANALPFPDGFFDAILMFSSIHHMPDPGASLRHCARKLKPGGLIGVLCEPIGHYYGDNIAPLLLNELKEGLNEQTFSLEEWAAIFEGAGLREREVIVDRGSLKAFLVPCGAKARE